MNRRSRSLVLAVVAVIVSVNMAKACIWDTTVVGHEKQFKSSYLDQQPPKPQVEASPSQRLAGSIGVVGGLGLGLVVGAMCIGLIRTREAAKTATKAISENTP